MGVRIDVQMTVNFAKVGEDVADRLDRGVHLAGERLLALSSEAAPFEWGTLVGSAAVSDEATAKGDPVAVVSYDTPYAARHHENPQYNFQNGRQGKYLEGPALEHRKELGDMIRKEVTGA